MPFFENQCFTRYEGVQTYDSTHGFLRRSSVCENLSSIMQILAGVTPADAIKPKVELPIPLGQETF